MAAYCQVYGVIHFTSPAGWLPVHRDHLRAQRSVTSMGKLYRFVLPVIALMQLLVVVESALSLNLHINDSANKYLFKVVIVCIRKYISVCFTYYWFYVTYTDLTQQAYSFLIYCSRSNVRLKVCFNKKLGPIYCEFLTFVVAVSFVVLGMVIATLVYTYILRRYYDWLQATPIPRTVIQQNGQYHKV